LPLLFRLTLLSHAKDFRVIVAFFTHPRLPGWLPPANLAGVQQRDRRLFEPRQGK